MTAVLNGEDTANEVILYMALELSNKKGKLGLSDGAKQRQVRTPMIELSWLWLRYQPNSALSQWFERRFAHGGKRMRRIGIVALARKLLIALWRYVEEGIVPAGATFKEVKA